ncbi:glycosyltransferase family 2 protein [Paenibacillus sp. MMS20-IR301]|uniref:glycosyltransferase family 2 protein n=1 Tax=Paenibacillus sp. MMS20-IR301 TaxID=2895946 RepID=UPI0028E3B6CE|nr:glycosyltransferase family 2 protein [Paenibacillus sp. MMS20-IR301]WNS42745.1 glycosyltransferase family 2 protein [Paenibacillus sp. MMS20-IR301]
MKSKTVSVHIVTYNSADDIIDCLSAVLAQDYPIKKIVVVDNASTDGSADKVRAFYHELNSGSPQAPVPTLPPANQNSTIIADSSGHNHCPSLVLLENERNTGFAPAHNQAIAGTSTDYVLVLNPDLTLASDYVSRLVARMETNPQIGSATGKLLLKADHQLVDSTGLRMNRARRAFDRGAGEPADQWNESGPVFGASGAAAMYSRRMIEDISVEGEFFDADFFAYKEDVDVAWRAGLFGWQSYYDAEAIGYHERGWKTSGRSGKAMFIKRISYINRYKMIYKNESSGRMWLTLLYSLPYEIAAHGYSLLKEPKLLGAWSSFFAQRAVLKRKRRYIQGKAKQLMKQRE